MKNLSVIPQTLEGKVSVVRKNFNDGQNIFRRPSIEALLEKIDSLTRGSIPSPTERVAPDSNKLIERIAKLEPTFGSYQGETYCFFCNGQHPGDNVIEHEPDCIWVLSQKVSGNNGK